MIYIVKIKKFLIPIFLIFFIIFLLLFSSSNLIAAKSGLIMWATNVVPSLFPFLVITELLLNTPISNLIGKIFRIIMKPFFNIDEEGSIAFLLGIICGYPIGAKIACDLRKKNILTKIECERLLSFTNNSSPMFILGTIGMNMYGNNLIGILLLITHILASLTTGFLFRFWNNKRIKEKKHKVNTNNNYNYNNYNPSNNNIINLSNFGEILSNSIINSISLIMMIGGFIVLFSVIISILKSSKILFILTFMLSPCFKLIHIPSVIIAPFITGIVEITNGIYLLSSIHIKAISINIILTSFILGLGGISIFLQILSIVSKTDLSIKPYIYGKIIQAIIASFYTFLLIQIFPIFNFDL